MRHTRPSSVPESKADLLRRFRDRYGLEYRCRTLLDINDGSAATSRIQEVFDQRCVAWVDVWTATRALNDPKDLWRLVEDYTRKARAPDIGEAACIYASAASMLAVCLLFARQEHDGESTSRSAHEG